MPKVRGNGEGSIYNNGRYWVGQITVGHNELTGKLIRKTYYAKTKKEVIKKITNLKYELNNNLYKEPSSLTFSEWAVYWLNNFKKNELADSTYEKYKNLIETRIIPYFGDIKLISLTSFHLQTYLNKLYDEGLKDGYISLIQKRISSILKKAVELELLNKNPCVLITKPKSYNKKEIIVFTQEEQNSFVEYCKKNKRYGYIFLFLLGTGVRVGEALALTWSDIDFISETVKIDKTLAWVNKKNIVHNHTKTKAGIRIVPLTPFVIKILTEIKNKQNATLNTLNLVFPSDNFEYINSANLRWHIKSFCKNAHLPQINIHALRHTFATRAIEKNVNIKALSEILGHKDISITLNTYAHALTELKKQSVLKINIF